MEINGQQSNSKQKGVQQFLFFCVFLGINEELWSLSRSFPFLTNLQYSWGFGVCHQLSQKCVQGNGFSTKSCKYKHQTKFSPKFQTDLPVMFHECNKVWADLLKKHFHRSEHSYLNSTTYRLDWTTKPECAQAQMIPLHAPCLFSLGNILRSSNVHRRFHRKERLHVLLSADCENIKQEVKKIR